MRIGALVVILLAVGLSHWVTPTDDRYLYIVHVVGCKLFLLPVVLAAVWFGLRGSLLTAGAVTVLYSPHVLLQWKGVWSENLSQLGEIAGVWMVAVVAGVLVRRSREAGRAALYPYASKLGALIDALEAQLPAAGQGKQVSEDRTSRHEAA